MEPCGRPAEGFGRAKCGSVGRDAEMSLHLHCPYCGELLAEDQQVVTTSAREGTRQETYDLACQCGTRLRLQLPPERWAPNRRRRHGRNRGRGKRDALQ